MMERIIIVLVTMTVLAGVAPAQDDLAGRSMFNLPDKCKVEGDALPPPDCIVVLNPPAQGGGVFIDRTINIDGSIFMNLPKEGLKVDGAPTLSPQVVVPDFERMAPGGT